MYWYVLPNSLRWVPKITSSREEMSEKCEEEKAKTNSGQANQQPHFHVIYWITHLTKAVFKDIYCYSWWSGTCEEVKTGWKDTKSFLSWINFKRNCSWTGLRCSTFWYSGQPFWKSAKAQICFSIEWCCFLYNGKFFEFLETGLFYQSDSSAYQDCFYVVNALPTNWETNSNPYLINHVKVRLLVCFVFLSWMSCPSPCQTKITSGSQGRIPLKNILNPGSKFIAMFIFWTGFVQWFLMAVHSYCVQTILFDLHSNWSDYAVCWWNEWCHKSQWYNSVALFTHSIQSKYLWLIIRCS